MRLALKEAGAEPDESWCVGEEKEFPDFVLEIALTSGGINKLELYRRFQVPEVWIWQGGGLKIFSLRHDNSSYEPVVKSHLLPKLDVTLLERCVRNHSWQQARREFRAGLTA
jgi:Uma2 family endonuclease